MGLVDRPRIDDGDPALANDVAERSLESERPRIVDQHPAHARHHLLDPIGRQVEAAIEGNVLIHQVR